MVETGTLNLPQKHTVFLDRDGVINEDSPDYIKSWEEFRFIAGSRSAIAELTGRGYRIYVVSNQSGIHRGLIEPATLTQMHRRMTASVRRAGGRIEGYFCCPHRPDENCRCRKPRAGLIRRASEKHGIDLDAAAMIGDSAKDILAARRAGCALSILVKTGNGDAAQRELTQMDVHPDHIAANLKSAAGWLIDRWK